MRKRMSQISDLSVDAILEYCCIEGYTGEVRGNITNNPLFVGTDNFHFQSNSPCTDAGTNINELTLVSSGFSLSTGETGNPSLSDKMHVYVPGSGYQSYFIHDGAWRNVNDPNVDLPTNVVFDPGSGFFYEAIQAFEWIEENPYDE